MNNKTFYCQSTGRALQPMEDQRADGRQLFRELSATTESRVLTHPAMLATHPPSERDQNRWPYKFIGERLRP